MSYIFSDIALDATERNFLQNAGHEVVYEIANEYINRVNSDMQSAISAFVSETTSKHNEKFKLSGGGRLQRRSQRGVTRNRKVTGSWDVSYPLEDFGDALETNDIALAYMTGRELSNHINGVVGENANTVRHEILAALFKSTSRTFEDGINPTLTLQPLANGDGVLYPPVIGAEVESAANHYIAKSYATIDNANDPFEDIVNALESRFGTPTGGSNIVAFINNAQTSDVRALAAFTPVADMGVAYGDDTSLSMVPPQLSSISSARVLGRHDDYGCWVVEWRYIPSGYIFSTHLDVSAPLKMRIDPADTGLGSGLQIVNRSFEYPMEHIDWRHRFGVAVSNRLNGVCVQLNNAGAYAPPAQFA